MEEKRGPAKSVQKKKKTNCLGTEAQHKIMRGSFCSEKRKGKLLIIQRRILRRYSKVLKLHTKESLGYIFKRRQFQNSSLIKNIIINEQLNTN